MATALLPINLTSLRTKISKLGTDQKDFKTLRSNKLAVITSTRESDKLTSIIANEYKDYKPKLITERSINIAGYEVIIKRHRDQRDIVALNIRNEFKFAEYINQAIKDNGYPLTINFRATSGGIFIVKDVIQAQHVGAKNIFAGNKADVVLITKTRKIPISLKQDNASFWGSHDTSLKIIAELFLAYVINKKITTLENLPGNKHVYRMNPRVAFPLEATLGNEAVFGNDIIPYGAVIIKTWKASDFILDYSKENIMDINCSNIFRKLSDIIPKYKPYFVFNNDATRNVASKYIPAGIRYVIQAAYNMGQVKIINDFNPSDSSNHRLLAGINIIVPSNITSDTIGILNRQPNLNFLQGLNFRMVIRKLPSTPYFAQRVNLAGMHLYGAPEQKTPLLNLPLPGVSLTYNDLVVTFRINADFSNYLELFTWLNGLGFPKDTEEYVDIKNEMHELNSEFGGVLSDLSIIVLNNKSQPIINFIYRDAFVYALSDIYLDTATQDPNYLLCEATFKYMDINIEQIVNGTV